MGPHQRSALVSTTQVKPLPCTEDHTGEVVASPQSCNAETLTTYVGGNPDVDVVRVHSILPVGKAVPCEARVAAPFQNQSMRGAFAGPAGEYLRLCVDDRLATKEVGCNAPHTLEYVGVADSLAPSLNDCELAAETYLRVGLNTVNSHLKVEAVQARALDATHPRCRLRARGSDLFNGSLRNLGTNALPLVSSARDSF